MSNIFVTAGVTAKSVTTTPLNLLSQSTESFEAPMSRCTRWRLSVYSATADITVKIYVRVGADANAGLVELTSLRTTVTAGAAAVTISGSGEIAQTIKVMGYTASGTAAVSTSFDGGD